MDKPIEPDKVAQLMSDYLICPDHQKATIVEELVSGFSRYLWAIAATTPHKQDVEDRYQAGILGLLQAIDTSDPNAGATFKTHAVINIWAAMRIYGGVEPSHLAKGKQAILAYRKARNQLRLKLGRRPTLDEIAEAESLDLSTAQVFELASISPRVLCDAIIENTQNVVDPHLQDKMIVALAAMSDQRTAAMIYSRYYDNHALQDIGDEYHISKQAVSAILSLGLAELKRSTVLQEFNE